MPSSNAATPFSPTALAPDACTQLLQHAPDAVLAIDGQGLVAAANPSARHLLGWPVDDATPRTLGQLLVPVRPLSGRAAFARYLDSGDPTALANHTGLVTLELQRPDGSTLVAEVSAFAAPVNGAPGSGLVLRDVSARGSPERALRQSEERYRTLVEQLGEGMCVLQDGRVVFANERAAEIMRVAPDDVVGADFVQWLHPDDREMAADRQRRRQLGEPVQDRYEMRRLDEDGSVRWMLIHATTVPWEGRPATMAFFSDVTERKAVMEALHTSEERYRAVVEHVSEGMVVIQNEVIVFANARAAEIARMTLEDMRQVGFLHRVHPDDHTLVRDRQRRRLAGEDVPNHYELRLLFPDGEVRWIAIGVSVVPWGGQPASLTFFTDVTENKAMLEAVRMSEERLRAVVEHAGEGMVVMLEANRVVFINSRALAIVRMSREDVEQRGLMHLLHPDDAAMMLERRSRRMAGENVPRRYEVRLIDADGGVRWIELGTAVVPWSGRKATMSFFSEITDRKLLERKLRSTLAERETILENSLVGIAFLTQDHRFRWSNRAMARIFGMRRGPAAPPSWEALFPSKQAYEHAVQDIAEHMRKGRDYQSEMRLRRIDGSLFWAAVSGKAVDAADAAQGTVWTVMDITQRKELEEALQRTSSEREAIFNSALVGISFNVNRRIQWVNDKCVEMLGYSRQELTGQPSRIFYADEATYVVEGRRTLEALLRDGHHTCERRLVRRSGETFWVQLAGRCVVDRNPDAGVIWTLLDITQRRQAEEDIRAALERQKELNELRSRFVSMTSHEFRTPLATILSSAELIKYYADRMPEAEKLEVLHSIESGVHRMTRMLDRMLLIGKADAQMLEFTPQELELKPLCEHCIEDARRQHPEAGAAIVLQYEARPAPGAFDEKLLRHIFGNLLSNAVKYSPDGGQVQFRISEDGAHTIFEVIDQGIGIPEQEMAHLFESFHRASNVGRIQGTGLGLAIVKKAVERHGGKVEVTSALGEGAHFTVTL
jgi:PAS domain S-box-containing protein